MLEKILNQKLEEIKPLDVESMRQAEERWKTVAKPLHSLGKLEEAVIRMAGIREDADFIMKKKGLVIFCADNGVVAEGVTQTGQEVTAIVADNFTKGATSVCIMAEKAGVDVLPVDIGMAVDVASLTDPSKKISYGTENMAHGPAMTREQAIRAILTGIEIAGERKAEGYDLLATGEMGIGNTTTSSAVASVLLGKRAEEVTGRGAGLSSEGLQRKIRVIRQALEKNRPDPGDVLDVVAKEYAPFVRKIEVEVENLDQVREAVEAGADIIMLDNMSTDMMTEAIKIIDGRAKTECSGNVTLENIKRLTSIGVDYISSGALTHSAPIMDISLKNLHPID